MIASTQLPHVGYTIALSLLLVAGGCTGGLAYRVDEATRSEFELPEGTHTVRVEVREGAMTFRPGDPGPVVVTAAVRRAADTEEGLAALEELEVKIRAVPGEPGVLELRGVELPANLDPKAHRVICKTVVQVPAGLAVKGKTGFGAMAAYSCDANVELETEFGPLLLKGCRGDAVLRTGGGTVLINQHRGGLDVWSKKCQTMQVFVDEIGPAGIRLVTQRGGIQAHVPGDAAFVLDAKTFKGKARNSFKVPVERMALNSGGLAMRGTVAGGGPVVFLEASKEGNISLRARNAR